MLRFSLWFVSLFVSFSQNFKIRFFRHFHLIIFDIEFFYNKRHKYSKENMQKNNIFHCKFRIKSTYTPHRNLVSTAQYS